MASCGTACEWLCCVKLALIVFKGIALSLDSGFLSDLSDLCGKNQRFDRSRDRFARMTARDDRQIWIPAHGQAVSGMTSSGAGTTLPMTDY